MTALLPKPAIDISVQDPEWESFKDLKPMIELTVNVALDFAILPVALTGRSFDLSVVLANDDLVQVLNREYRQKDKPTNVLTFAQIDDEAHDIPEGVPYNLGDVILSFQTIEREAQEQGKFLSDHFKHILVHGVLHLLGYDHETDEQATDMETLEIRILERLNVQNPYTETEF